MAWLAEGRTAPDLCRGLSRTFGNFRTKLLRGRESFSGRSLADPLLQNLERLVLVSAERTLPMLLLAISRYERNPAAKFTPSDKPLTEKSLADSTSPTGRTIRDPHRIANPLSLEWRLPGVDR